MKNALFYLDYKFDEKLPIDPGTKVDWMDGDRLLMRSSNKAIMVDYDGENQQDLGLTLPGLSVSFDRDYTVLYRINSDTSGKIGFSASDLRLAADK